MSKSYIELYNPFHDRLGRFTFKRGSVNVSKKGLEKTTGAKTRPTEEVKKWVSAHKRELVVAGVLVGAAAVGTAVVLSRRDASKAFRVGHVLAKKGELPKIGAPIEKKPGELPKIEAPIEKKPKAPVNIRKYDIFGGEEVLNPTDEDVNVVTRTVNDIRRIVDIGDPEIAVGSDLRNANGMVTVDWGSPYPRKDVIAIDTRHIAESVKRSIKNEPSDAEFKSWYYGAERNYESLLEHTVAHECGHWHWMFKMGDEVKFSWRKFATSSPDVWSLMSEYARFNSSYIEAYADGFARFTTGSDLPQLVEEWFWNNI